MTSLTSTVCLLPAFPSTERRLWQSAQIGHLQRRLRVMLEYDPARLGEVRRRQDLAIERVRATGAVIEVLPHVEPADRRRDRSPLPPVPRFLEAWVLFVVATDSPGTFDTSLSKELDWVCKQTAGGDDLRRTLVEVANQARADCLSGRALG